MDMLVGFNESFEENKVLLAMNFTTTIVGGTGGD
jgi:hypothetical protein